MATPSRTGMARLAHLLRVGGPLWLCILVVNAALLILTSPVTTLEDVPDGFKWWRRFLASVGGTELQTAVLVLTAIVVVGAVVAPKLRNYVRSRRAAHAAVKPAKSEEEPPAFETSEGGQTLVEGGSVEGYKRVSRVANAVARFIDVKIMKR